jgi:hypothetical protein
MLLCNRCRSRRLLELALLAVTTVRVRTVLNALLFSTQRSGAGSSLRCTAGRLASGVGALLCEGDSGQAKEDCGEETHVDGGSEMLLVG